AAAISRRLSSRRYSRRNCGSAFGPCADTYKGLTALTETKMKPMMLQRWCATLLHEGRAYEFEGKMLGLIGVSGGRGGASGAMHSLRDVGRALHAWVIPEQASVADVEQVCDEDGRCKDAEIEKRLKDVGRQVVRFAYLHAAERAEEFLREYQ